MKQSTSQHTRLDSGELTANRVDIPHREVRASRLRWSAGVIRDIEDLGPPRAGLGFLIPGFVDAHLHIESSMLPRSLRAMTRSTCCAVPVSIRLVTMV